MSGLFVCDRCNCVDMVEVCYPHGIPITASDLLCSECKTGCWHGLFDKTEYSPEKDLVDNRPTGLSLG